MQVAVIGGGIAGISSAFFLAQAGHEVVVVERQTNVAEGASFGSAGVLSPVHALPWAAPGMPKKLLSTLLKPESPLWIEPRFNAELWRWGKLWLAECEAGRHSVNRERCYRIASYSQHVMRDAQPQLGFDYESTQGYLQLYRTPRERAFAASLQDFLVEHGVAHRWLEPEEAYLAEPALGRRTPLAGALQLAHDEAGNCPLYCKQLRGVAQSLGVAFHFGTNVDAIETAPGDNLFLRLGRDRFAVDAVVLAAGGGSAALLAPLGIRLPFFPLRTYAATVAIRNFDDAPRASLADTAYYAGIARIGTRVRIAGTAELGVRTPEMRTAAIRTLLKVGQDWFPDAANYNTATFWCDALPTLPDGPPILGTTPIPNLYLNIGHGMHAWSMSMGAGRVVADLVSGRAPEIDLDGLTMERYG